MLMADRRQYTRSVCPSSHGAKSRRIKKLLNQKVAKSKSRLIKKSLNQKVAESC